MKFTRAFLWIFLAIVLIGGGFLIPAYFRAIDFSVLQVAGNKGPERSEIAESLRVGGASDAAAYLLGDWSPERSYPIGLYPFWSELVGSSDSEGPAVRPLLSSMNRATAIAILAGSGLEGARVLIQGIPIEPPVNADPALRLAVLPLRIGGILTTFLAADRSFQPEFLGKLVRFSSGNNDSPTASWNLFSSAVSVWGSIAPHGAISEFLASFSDPDSFLDLAGWAERPSSPSREFLIRVILGGADPKSVFEYLRDHPTTGADDLNAAFALGPGAVDLLVHSDLPLRDSSIPTFASPLKRFSQPAALVFERPRLALSLRLLLFFGGCLCLVKGLASILPNPGDQGLARPGFFQNVLRKAILASILTATLLFILEPSLLRQPESPGEIRKLTISLDSITNTSRDNAMINSISIDPVTLLILSLFLVLQLGLYVFCLVKLSEVRRQPIPEQTKIRLLENEENLFDSGLYLGLGGTVASLILLAVGVVEASLMAAYASTLFGILFVSFFKIFHLRPLKRKLILANDLRG